MITIKNSEHIKNLKESGSILSRVLDELGLMIKPGVTPEQLNQYVIKRLKELDGIPSFLGYNGFPAALCTSVNDRVIHGIPDNTPLEEGDIIGCDLGVTHKGMISDSARTFAVGMIPGNIEKLLVITREALFAGINAVKPGGRIRDISKAVSETVRPHGYGIVHSFCGHGVGFEVHEEPQIPNNYPSRGKNPRMKPGMVLAIEPMINLGTAEIDILDDNWTVVTQDGLYSAHFEHTVVVTETGFEIMTGDSL